MAENTEPTVLDTEATGQEPTNDGVQDTQQSDTQAPEVTGGDDWKDAEIKKLRAENAKHRTRANALEQAQAERERQEAEKRGEYERLYKESAQELSALRGEIETLRTFRAEVEEREETKRKALLQKLPDDLRDTFQDATAPQIQTVLERIAATGASPVTNRTTPKPSGDGRETPPAPETGQPGWLNDYLQRGQS